MGEKYELELRQNVSNNSIVSNEKYDLAQIDNNKEIKQEKKGVLANLIRNWDKYVYTFCILLNYINFGIVANLAPGAMVDMKFMLRTSMAMVNYGTTIQSIGYLTGSFIGFLYKFINRQLSLLTLTAVMGVFAILIPMSKNIWQFYLFTFITWVGCGAWDSGNTVWIIEMWTVRSPPVLQLQQMTYGLGAIVGPLLISPYVSGDLSNETDVTTSAPEWTTDASTVMSTTVSVNYTTPENINYSIDRRSKLTVPYLIGGIMALSGPIILLIMFFIKRYKIPEEEKQTSDEKTVSKETVIIDKVKEPPLELSSRTRIILIVLFALSLMTYNALETTFMTYAATYYQYLPIKISAQKAAQMTAILSATYTAGRGLSSLIASRVRPDIMLSYHMVIVGISLVILSLGQNKEVMLYIGMSTLGFGYSALWPSYISYAEQTIRLTDRINSIFAIASCLLMLTSPFVIGPLIEKHPDILINLEFTYFASVVFLFITILIIVKRSQRYPVIYTVN